MKMILWIEEYLSQAEKMIFEGRVEEGMNILRELLYEEPGYATVHNYLGWAYMYHVNNASLAELHFKTAMIFEPEYAPPYLHMGNLMNRLGRYAEAIGYFTAGLSKPDAIRTALMEGMALAYEMQKQYKQAIRTYKIAATTSAIDYEVERMLNAAKRCRKKRLAVMFSFW